jgi:hypothetical protein
MRERHMPERHERLRSIVRLGKACSNATANYPPETKGQIARQVWHVTRDQEDPSDARQGCAPRETSSQTGEWTETRRTRVGKRVGGNQRRSIVFSDNGEARDLGRQAICNVGDHWSPADLRPRLSSAKPGTGSPGKDDANGVEKAVQREAAPDADFRAVATDKSIRNGIHEFA